MTTLADLFTAGARRYDLMVGLNPGYHRHLRRAAERLAHHASARRVLDLGCGTGASTQALLTALSAAHVTGVDAAPGMIARARAKSWPDGRVEFLVGRAGDPSVTAHLPPVDACLAAYLLRNIPPPERTAVLAAVREQIVPGGILVLQDYTVSDSARARRVWDVVCHLVVIPLAALTLRDTRLFRYLWRSAREMEGVPAWCSRLQAVGFTPLEVHHGSGWQRGILHTVIARRT